MSGWMKEVVAAAAVASGVAATTPVHADDVFIKLDTIQGESQDSKHNGEIEALAWSWGVVQSGARPQISDITISKKVDKSTPLLAQAAASGKHIKSAVLVVRSAGGKSVQEYIKLSLDDVLVTSVKLSGDKNRPTETVNLNFAKIKLEYREQRTDGSLGGAVTFSWDVKANKQ